MSNLLPQMEALQAKVLRLKMLLDWLHVVMESYLPPNGTQDDVARIFHTRYKASNVFWNERKPGGKEFISAVRDRIGKQYCADCDAIIVLLDELSDNYKALVPYSKETIELAFELFSAFLKARNQPNVPDREQITAKQFGSFFGSHQEFAESIALRRINELTRVTPELTAEVRAIISSIDWATARPGKPQAAMGSAKEDDELKKLVAGLQKRYPSRWAMCQALGVHHQSLKKALAHQGRPETRESVLAKVRTLASGSNGSHVSVAPNQPKEGKTEINEPFAFAGSMISSLHSIVKMGESAALEPTAFTDGHRDSIIRLIAKLMSLAQIDAETFKRLQKVEGLAADDPALRKVFSAFGENK
ncbi:MAG: hypothetical protein KW788_01425 [Candidatus Doudnabacteria bacterium]|nr:hypothetical protein [Candidatus Doudnabacteria bacterium]